MRRIDQSTRRTWPMLPPDPPQERIIALAVDIRALEECSQFVELIGSVVVSAAATTRDIYEPNVHYLGIAEEIVKYRSGAQR